MKRSTIFHLFSILAGIAGAVALFATWLAGKNLYNDAIALLLISVASGICTLIYLKQGK